MIGTIHSDSAPRLLLLCLLALTAPISAQNQTMGSPGVPLPVPEQTNVPVDAALNPRLPTIFIVGDSTARNKANLGWGDHFAQFFDTARVNVANRAIAGRSSRTYIADGSWDKVLSEMKSGDYVLLQLGHNDGGSALTPDFKGRGSWKGVGEETVQIPIVTPYKEGPFAGKSVELVHTYGWYLRKYIADTRAKGATPILLTVTIRNIWATGQDGRQHIEQDMGFKDYESQVGASEHVAVVDMASVAAGRFEALGPERTAKLFPIDHTHTSATGAEMNAQSVAIALHDAESPIGAWMKPL